jgi:methionyl aminopeptidase
VSRVSSAIAAAIQGRGVRPIQNLCGHGVGRYVVHCPPAVLNVPDSGHARLEEGMVIAIEPFATTGVGTAVERGTAEVFRLAPDRKVKASVDPAILARMRAFNGLPFARRQLTGMARADLETALSALRRSGDLAAYPPLVEESNAPVAQAEHTVYVGREGVEVLTR